MGRFALSTALREICAISHADALVQSLAWQSGD